MASSAMAPVAGRKSNRGLRMASLAAMALLWPGAIALAQTMTSPPFDAGAAGQTPGLSSPPEMSQPPALSLPPELSQPPQPSAPPEGCQENMAKYSQRRNAQLQSINALMKGGKGKGIDPIAACPKFRTLVTIESEMRAWVLKNKDWCGIPDEIVDQMKAGFAKTPQFAQRACAAAAQARKNAQIQAQGGGAGGGGAPPPVKLPAGPL